MFRTAPIGVWMVVFLTTSAISCEPPKQSEDIVSISQEAFEQLTRSEEWYGYRGSGNIMDVADLGSLDLEISLDQATVNAVLSSIVIAGQVIDIATREGLPKADVVIGKVEYQNDKPFRFLPKTGVVSGDNGAFIIDSKIKAGDRLFVACLGYVVKVYDISKLIDSPQRRMP